MLMMLAVCGFVPKLRTADAHDAGCLKVTCPKSAQLMLMMLVFWGYMSCPKYAQLMLMMLGVPKLRPANAHDAACLGGNVSKKRSAHAHDAGCLGLRVQSTPS